MRWQELTWPQIAAVDRDRTLVLIPIASCEQHSHHLPTFTDSILCGAVVEGLEASLPNSLLTLPVQWLGASDHHLPFGGTITSRVDRHVDLVEDMAASVMGSGFRRLLVVNGHGGNEDTMRVALRRLQPTFADRLLACASYWEWASEDLARLLTGPRKKMGHACELETSMILHLRPDLVHVDRVRDDHRSAPAALSGVTLVRDFSQMTGPGAIGSPSQASAEKGQAMLSAIIARGVEVCRELLAMPIVTGRRPVDLPVD